MLFRVLLILASLLLLLKETSIASMYQKAYNKLYPNIEHKPKAVQLSFNLNQKR